MAVSIGENMTNKIANWDNLTEEQKNTALKLLEGQAGMNPAVVHPAAKFFEKNHWVKIDKFIDQNMANLLYHHVQLEAKRLNYLDETLGKGYDTSNVDSKKYPNWDWPMFVKETNGTEIPVHMKPGDMIIYRGCEVEHWREPFWGKNHAQVFLHYNEKEGQYNIPYDGRPVLGLPASFRAKDALLRNESMSYDEKPNISNISNNTVNKKIIY